MSSAEEAAPKGRSWLRRARRVLLVLLLLVVAGLAGVWAWLESDAGQERMRRWLEDRAAAALQRDVRIDHLDWNLLPFSAVLSGIEIAGAPTSDQPLLRADALFVRIDPWRLMSRELRLEAVEVEAPLVHWDAESGSNLALEAGGGGALAVTVGSLAIDDGAVEINHRRWELDSSLSSLTLRLQPVAGADDGSPRRSGLLRIGSGGIRLGTEDPEVADATPRALDLVEAEVPFIVDEDLLRIEPARLALGDSELTASGTLTDWSRLQLAVEGRLQVRDLIGLSGVTLAEGDGGTVRMDGELRYGPEPFRFAGSLAAPALTLAGIEATDLTAVLDASGERVMVDDLGLSLFAGTVAARVEVDLTTRPRTWTLSYEVRDVDLNEVSASPALPGFRFAGIAAASGELAWSDPIRDTLSGAGSFDLDLPGDTLEGLARRATAAVADTAGTAPTRPEPAPVTGAGEPLQRVAPSLPLPVTAHAEFEVDAGALAISDASASLPNNQASLDARIGRDGDVAATVDVQSDDLRILDRFFNQIRRFRGEQPVPRPIGIEGTGRVAATIGGSLDAPTLDGRLEARSLSVAGNPVGDVDGDLRLSGAALEIRDLRLRRDGGSGRGDGRLRIGERVASGPDYSFVLRLESFPMEVKLPRVGVPLEAAGETSGEIELSGSYGGAPVGLVTLRGESVRLNELRGLSADVQVRLDPDQWIAERFELRGERGALTVSGAWRRDDDTVQMQLEAIDLDAASIGALTASDLPVSGSLQLQATLTGAFSAPDAAATLRLTEAGAYGVTLGAVAASTELRAGRLAVSAIGRAGPDAPAVPPPTPTAAGGDVAIPLDTIPPGGWAATLSADLRAPRRATVRASGASDLVLAFLAAQGYDTSGTEVSGTLELEGGGVLGEWVAWEGNAVLSDFVLTRPGLAFSIPRPLLLELGERQLQIDLPELVSDAGSLQAGGIIDLETGVWLEATSSGVVSLDVLGTLSDELDASGTLEVDLEATGEVLAGEVAGSFELYEVTLTHAASPWTVEDVNGTIRLADNILDLGDVRGLLSGRRFTIDGDLPLAALAGDESAEPFAVDLTIDALPLAPLWDRAGALQELITGGEAAITASLRGHGADWRSYQGRVDVRALTIDLTDLRLSAPRPAALVIAGERLEVVDPIVLEGPGTDLRVNGAFLFAPFRLDTVLQGTMALDPLNAVTRGWGIAGRAEVDVRVSGNPPALAYDGTMTVSSGLLNAPVLQPIENISAELSLDGRLLRIDRFVGALGEVTGRGTNVSASGEIQLVDSVPQRFELGLDVESAQIRLLEGIRLTTSADLLLQGTLERSVLSGTMAVAEGEYRRRWDPEADFGGFSGTGATVAGVDHPAARAVTLDLGVSAPGQLRIVNNVADIELSADLQVRGTLAEPVILGRTTVLDGSILFRDQRYRFQRGSVEFQNPLRTEPSFDIAMETSIRQYLVTVIASGSPARGDVEIDFISSPPLSDLQLIQLLTTGNAPEETDLESVSLESVGAQATSFLTRQYLSQVERGAQRVFGVDRFNVEPAVTTGSGDPTARVTIGKQVTPDLWVSWTTVLGTTEEQLVSLEYQLTRGIRLTATREEDGAIGVDIRFDHRFR